MSARTKKISKFILYFILCYFIIEILETIINNYWNLNIKLEGYGTLLFIIVYGFKFHIFCCLFPFLFATYKTKKI